jgi:D-lactate dehydrogenase (cytochrome)
MAEWVVKAREARGELESARLVADPDRVAPHLTDAAHVPGGHAAGLATPASEAAVAALLRASARVLPIGAQSSLTGGATPMGEVLLSTARLNRVEIPAPDRVHAGAGVTLAALDDLLAPAGRYYPPASTFVWATIGGNVATNAAGAATFKYGTTRDWVRALTVVLADGDVLDLERGACQAHPDGYFELDLARGRVRVPVPSYEMPAVAKLSAGYYARPGMDLVDLFIASEGTLGVVTEVTLRVLPARPPTCLALVPFGDRDRGIEFARALREDARIAQLTGGSRGIDVSAIEYMDGRSLALLREDAGGRADGVDIPAGAAVALLIALELPPGTTERDAFDQVVRLRDPDAPDTPLLRFCARLLAAGVFDDVLITMPGDSRGAGRLIAFREAVPSAVNAAIGRAQASVDARIEKTAGDMLVPVDRLAAFLDACAAEFGRRGLDAAVWGHVSDGNVHPNVIPRSFADVESGRAGLIALGREAIRLGGTPLAEHGVGRNPIKQLLLKELYSEEGIEAMRAVKRAIDPQWKLAPGVIFSR